MADLQTLRQAVERGDAEELCRLLSANPGLRAKLNEPLFSFDSPAIVAAAGRGNRAVMDVLLEAGADINARSQWWAGGFGVLDFAGGGLAEHLIRHGATVDAHAAARLGMMERLRELVAATPALVHARGGDGKTPLHCAATVEIAEYLLGQGAEIDAEDVDHESTAAQHLVQWQPEVTRYLMTRGCRTDLLMAAATGDLTTARRLLDERPESIRMRIDEQFFPKRNPRAGGTIYIWTLGKNLTPHQVARKFSQPEVWRLLLERSPDEVRLTEAFGARDESEVRALLRAHPEWPARLPETDLGQIVSWAEANDTETVRLMLRFGWPAGAGAGTTALHWAAFHGNAEMARALLEQRPDLEQRDPAYRSSPLGWAIHGSENGWYRQSGDYGSVVEALLRAGARLPEGTGGSAAVRAAVKNFVSG